MLHTRETAARPVWKYLLISSYICWRLSGEAVIDVSLACRTLLFDVNMRAWSGELLAAAGFREDQLPLVVPAGSVAGRVKPDMAMRLGLPGETKVVIGAHDQVANALACGVALPGDAADVSGTSECITPLFEKIPGGFGFERCNYACVPYVGGRGFVTYAYNLSGGSVVRWFRDSLAVHLGLQAKEEGLSVYDLLNRAAPGEPGSLLVLPYLQGMGGTPVMVPGARGLVYGLSMDTGLPDIYRAILEGLTFEMACNLESLAGFGISPKRLFACGGGARSALWLSIKADVWNREIIPVKTEETGALGSAILGFAAVSGEKDVIALAKRFVRHGEPVRPNPRRADIYMEKLARYKRFRSFIMEEASQFA
jgi:xylulokinase